MPILTGEESPRHRIGYPLLQSTEMTRIDDVLASPDAFQTGLVDVYAKDPDFRAHIAAIEQGYDMLADGGDITEARLHRMIGHQYLDAAIKRRATSIRDAYYEGSYEGFDMDFCKYLDFAFPISPQDTVSIHSQPDVQLHWMDYVYNGGVFEYHGSLEDQPSEEVSPSDSEIFQKRLDIKLEQRRSQSRVDVALFVGGVAIIAATETVLPNGALVAVGATLGTFVEAAVGIKIFSQAMDRRSLREAVKNSLIKEKLAEILPVIAPPHGIDFALESLQREHDTALFQQNAALKAGDKSWMGFLAEERALSDLLRNYTAVGDIGLEQAIAWLIGGLLNDLDSIKNYDLEADSLSFKIKLSALNRNLPIDQDNDRLTPINPFTGEKTWESYINWLVEIDNTPTRRAMLTAAEYPIGDGQDSAD